MQKLASQKKEKTSHKIRTIKKNIENW